MLSSAETFTLYRRHINRLSTVQLRHLRTIIGISWKDKVTNVEVLNRTNMPSIESILAQIQLRWTGHVLRMPEERIPKALLYSELSLGKRTRGRLLLRYKDVVKRAIRAAGIPDDWECLAKDRPAWRRLVQQGAGHIQDSWAQSQEERRARRHARAEGRPLQASSDKMA